MLLSFLAVLALPTGNAHATENSVADPVLVHACDQGVPEGWNVIEEASGLSETSVLCNYRVDRSAAAGTGNASQSGVAITIEYFCSADAGREAFLGKTGERKTETFRSDTMVITEEGPLAQDKQKNPNKDNPQPNEITSIYFDVGFTLQEKAWAQYGPQIVATLYLLTNERGVTVVAPPSNPDDTSPVSLRIQPSQNASPQIDIIHDVDPVGRIVANNHLPADRADCPSPAPLAGVASLPGKSDGGGPGTAILIGGAVALVGGIAIKRRPKGVRPQGKMPGGATDSRGGKRSMPPQCVELDHGYTKARDRLIDLNDLHQDISEQLHKAEHIHHLNILRANAALGLDAGRLIGVPLDLAIGMSSPSHLNTKSYVRPQWDTWKPAAKLALSPSVLATLATLENLAEKAREQAAYFARQLATLAEHPEIRALRAKVAAVQARLQPLMENLRLSQWHRQELERVRRVFSSNVEETGRVAKNIALMEEQVTSMQTALPLREGAARDALGRQLFERTAALNSARQQHIQLVKKAADLTAERGDLLKGLTEAGNVQRADLGPLVDLNKELTADAAGLEARMRGEMSASLKRSQSEQYLAEHSLQAARQSAQRLTAAGQAGSAAVDPSILGPAGTLATSGGEQLGSGTGTAPADASPGWSQNWGVGRGTLRLGEKAVGFVLSPLIWVFEKGFGRSQSAQEILDFLVRGKEHVAELQRALTIVDRGVRQERAKVTDLHGRVAQCIKQWEGAA